MVVGSAAVAVVVATVDGVGAGGGDTEVAARLVVNPAKLLSSTAAEAAGLDVDAAGTG